MRGHREELENLVELGGLLREAQENLAGDQLRALDVQRRQLVTALTRQARSAAELEAALDTAAPPDPDLMRRHATWLFRDVFVDDTAPGWTDKVLDRLRRR